MTEAAPFLVDANVFIRFLLNDHPVHSEAAKRVVARAEMREITLEVPFIALTEMVFTLGSFYKRDRAVISLEILKILKTPGINFRGPKWAFDALEEFGKRNVSFGDACIAAEARVSEIPVYSFDKDLDGFADIVRFEPK
jgi:predicted nucleic acid-binding protein